MTRLRGHRLAEARSLALHREIARRILADPKVLDVARARVEGWKRSGDVAPEYADRWAEILRQSPERIARSLTADDEAGRDLRQVTPFAGIVPPRERWEIWEAVTREAS